MTDIFPFYSLPPEIRQSVLRRCDSLTLTALLGVSRATNQLVKQIMADKLRDLLGMPDALRYNHDDTETLNRGMVVSCFSPSSETETHQKFLFNYMESNDQTNFNYRFDFPYSSNPSSAYNSDDDDDDESVMSRVCSRVSSISTVDDAPAVLTDNHQEFNHPFFQRKRPRTEDDKMDLNAHSKFSLQKTSTQVFPHDHYCASLDIGSEDYFGNLILRVSLGLNKYGNTPIHLMELSQRVDSNWWMEDEYIVHNRTITYRMMVDRVTRDPIENQFGELVHRYNVDISEIIFNTGYLLNTIENTIGVGY